MRLGRDTLIHAERARYFDGIEVHIAQRNVESDRIAVAQSLMFVEQDEGAVGNGPALHLDKTSAQRLMDELWNCGLRPSEGTGSAGSLAATERHLADMRTMAFHALKVK